MKKSINSPRQTSHSQTIGRMEVQQKQIIFTCKVCILVYIHVQKLFWLESSVSKSSMKSSKLVLTEKHITTSITTWDQQT